ncbi:MAG: biotin--[acetyl-CoA-carboxylase] ligase, partial [Alphaproteobacteria bacterium]|nr:biotin--[acetyl-CoA-carboxylase] ligase [Alphaproteobacteria bacterium]
LFPASKAVFGFKWPNDLLLNMKKYGGILVESRNGRIIVGIGLNLMGFPPNTAYPATCLAAAGIAAKPADLLKTLVPKLDAALIEGATAEGWDRIRKALGPKLAHAGGQIRVQGPREVVEGICEGLAEDGALMLRLKDGTQRMIHSGEVFDALGD